MRARLEPNHEAERAGVIKTAEYKFNTRRGQKVGGQTPEPQRKRALENKSQAARPWAIDSLG